MWLTYLLDTSASLMDNNASRCVCDVKKLTETVLETKKKERKKRRREERSDDAEIKSAGDRVLMSLASRWRDGWMFTSAGL